MASGRGWPPRRLCPKYPSRRGGAVKIVVFGDEGRVGALAGDHVVDLNRADAAIPPRLDAFIQAGQPALELADRALRSSNTALPVDQIRLRSPWPGRRIACMGGNYAD